MGRDRDEARRKPDNAPQLKGARVWVSLEALQSKAFAGVSPCAKGLFLCLIAQLRIGKHQKGNNGDLTTAIKVLETHGWKNRKTIAKAAKELEDAMLIVRTRQGRLPNVATLYAVTYAPLNESPKLEITAREFPFRAYMLKEPMPALLPVNTNRNESGIGFVTSNG
jgi:hypothetical protein